MALRGPAFSTHFPPKAADRPRVTMARLKIHPRVVSFQSSGAAWLMPISLVIGRLKTLNAYTWPMARWMERAAGGTSHRLYPGFATVCSRSRNLNIRTLLLEKYDQTKN